MTTVVAEVDDAPPSGPEAPPPSPPAPSRRTAAAGVLALVALAVPFVAIAVVAATRPWLPSLDLALMELRTFDVGGPLTPLTGAYSRLGWNHPGPMSFWLLALPYRLSGARPAALLLGTVALHATAVAATVAVARRQGGWRLALFVTLLLAVVVRGFGAGYLALDWNPDVPVLAVAFLVVATWAVWQGRVALLPAVVFAACFAWQSHIAFAPVTVTLTVAAVAGAVVGLRRRRDEPGTRRAAARVGAATVVTALVCLAPLAVEQATNDPGNLTLIARSFRHPHEETIPFDRALSTTAQHLSPVGAWLTGEDPFEPFAADASGANPLALILVVAAVGGALGLGRRTGGAARAPTALLAVTALAAAAGFVAVARTTGLPYYYLFSWFRPVAALLWGSVAWTVVAALAERGWPTAAQRARVASVAVVAAVLVTGGLAVSALRTNRALDLPDESLSEVLQQAAPPTVAALRGVPRVNLRFMGGWCGSQLGLGLVTQLVKNGTEVAVPSQKDFEYLRERVGEDPTLPRVELVCGPIAVEYLRIVPYPPVVAESLLTLSEAAELRALQEGFRADLVTGRRELLKDLEGREDGEARQIRKDLEDLTKAVDLYALPVIVRKRRVPVPLDPVKLARFDELVRKADRAVAVIIFPAGVPPL